MLWLEPLVEVETAEGRVAYGPVQPSDVLSLLDSGLLEGGDHALRLGRTDQIEWLAATAAGDLRSGRRDRPAVARRTTWRTAAWPGCAGRWS